MQVKLLRDCGVRFKNCKAGDVIDVSPADGRYLVAVKLAEPHTAEPEPKTEPKTETSKSRGKRK